MEGKAAGTDRDRVPAAAGARPAAGRGQDPRSADGRRLSRSRVGERSHDRQPREAHPPQVRGDRSRVRRDRRRLRRRLPLRPPRAMIARRLLAFNLLVLFLPGAALFYLDVYESRLLEELERSMVQRGRLAAAAVSGNAAVDPAGAAAILRPLDACDARLAPRGIPGGAGVRGPASSAPRPALAPTPPASE